MNPRNRTVRGRLALWVLTAACLAIHAPGSSLALETPPAGASAATHSTLLIGGVGGVYFLAEPGELTVEVVKRDRNRRGTHTELRAILLGPDRRILQEATIPDDGQPRGSGLGPLQQCRLTAQVEAKGVYVLNITVSQDRYGEEVIWGFRSNCRKYLIETARGHKDERHQESIVLATPERAADVCFVPPVGAFALDVTGLPTNSPPLMLLDGQGRRVASLPVDANGRVSHRTVPEASSDARPWRLHLPAAQATLNIDGVTRWEAGDPHSDMACWTPDLESWFPFLEHRWLLTPYSRTAHGQPGEHREVVFQVHNNAAHPKTIRLEIEFPNGPWPARISEERVTVAPGRRTQIAATCTVPATGETRLARIRATPLDQPGFSTYSTLTVQAGDAPATQPLAMPIVLQPYQHQNELFGHLPDYPVENQAYFDQNNRPFIRTSDGVAVRRDGHWTTTALQSAVRASHPLESTGFELVSTKIAFDRDNDLYLLARAGRTAVLLHSTNGGQDFAACAIPSGDGRPQSFDFEQFSGHNVLEGPPPLVRYTQTARDGRLIWRRLNQLELFVPKKVEGRVVLGEPVLISDKCIGLSAHSGIPASVVSRGAKVHVVWGEATDPSRPVPGVPTYVVTFDRETRELGEPVLVAHGPPANDVHNSPSITMDREGHLHVLAGTHGRPFPYARSLTPNTAEGGWTEAALTGDGLRQTYIGLVCGPDNTLHSVFRLWRSGEEPFPLSTYATLAYQRKRPGRPWEAPRVLIVPPFSEYSVFYHRLTIDRQGRLFLSYDYWSTFWFYRNDHFGRRRAMLMSPDGGDSWKLAETRDLSASVR